MAQWLPLHGHGTGVVMHPVQLLLSAFVFMLALDEFFEAIAYLMFGPNKC